MINLVLDQTSTFLVDTLILLEIIQTILLRIVSRYNTELIVTIVNGFFNFFSSVTQVYLAIFQMIK